MYVSREILSIKDLQQIVGVLQKQKEWLQQEFAEHCGASTLWSNPELQVLDAKIARFQRRLELITNQKQALQKLSSDIEQAMKSYENTCSGHAEQRSESIFRIREWLEILHTSKQSASDQYLTLAKCIVRELNSVEHDHNQSSFSRLFTESRLARAYMEVLRENCIDPYAEKYLAGIEYKTVVSEDVLQNYTLH